MTTIYEPAAPATDTRSLSRQFVELALERERLEAELTRVKADMATIEPQLLTEFEDQGQQRATLLGRTIYIRTQHWPKVLDKGALHGALAAAGMGDLVEPKVNSQSLGARLRDYSAELKADGTWDGFGSMPVPAKLMGVVEMTPKSELRVISA